MNSKYTLVGIIVLMAALVTAGALFLYPYQSDNPPQVNDTDSTLQGIQNVVDANNKFAFDIYAQLNKDEEKNAFYSPYSLSTALAMTYEGARGQTADEMKAALYFPENSILKPNSASIYNTLNKKDKPYTLSTGNALWVQKDSRLIEDYKVSVEKYYGGKAANLDFIKETEKSRQTINTFIEEQTNKKIKDLIPAGALDANTRLVLTNAIYFKGTWEWEFDKGDTKEEDFKITPNNVVKTHLMQMNPEKARFNYVDIGEAQLLELPYKGNDISMLIILPSENLASIEPSLSIEKLNGWKSQMQETSLDTIYLPKFEFDTKYLMTDTLKALGMSTAFNPDLADFSGMSEEERLYISSVIHQAYVKVDEQGTEAAAATAVGVGMTTVAPPKKIFRADHPFIFIIQQKETGNILFIGRVTDPNK